MNPNFTRVAPSSFGRISVCSSVLLLVATLAVVARTVVVARRVESVNTSGATAAFRDPAEKERRLRDFVGTFMTGQDPGDRVIVIEPSGRIQFHLINPVLAPLGDSDSYDLRGSPEHPVLVTPRSGVVEMLDVDRLRYYDDIYQRSR